jgi:hypothetical protein
MPQNSPITHRDQFVAGDDKTLRITIDNDGSIAGWALSFIFKRSRFDADADALFTKTVGDGVTISDAVNGVVDVQIDRADTVDAGPGMSYWYDLVRTDTGSYATEAYGNVVLL